MSRLTRNVNVDGTWYGPAHGNAEAVPAEAASRIGKHAWEGNPPAASLVAPAGGEKGLESGGREVVGELPPTSGSGSSREDWLRFAQANDVDVAEPATRAEIIAAVEAASVGKGD